jgi:hypothetical protein
MALVHYSTIRNALRKSEQNVNLVVIYVPCFGIIVSLSTFGGGIRSLTSDYGGSKHKFAAPPIGHSSRNRSARVRYSSLTSPKCPGPAPWSPIGVCLGCWPRMRNLPPRLCDARKPNPSDSVDGNGEARYITDVPQQTTQSSPRGIDDGPHEGRRLRHPPPYPTMAISSSLTRFRFIAEDRGPMARRAWRRCAASTQ